MKLSRTSALVLACLMLGGVAIRADELPHDLQKVRSLTPEAARRLVEEFKLHGSLPGGTNGLYLRGLTTLSADTAAALAEFTGPFLELDRLSSLDARTAKALAGYQGHLSLNGVTELPEETAKSLAKSRSDVLFLNGLSTVSAAAATELAGYKGKWLYLDGLSTMPGDGAEALGRFGGEVLSLQGLAELSPEAARGLATYTGPGPSPAMSRCLTTAARAIVAFWHFPISPPCPPKQPEHLPSRSVEIFSWAAAPSEGQPVRER